VNVTEIRKAYPLEPVQIVAELIALSVVEHSYTPATSITLSIDGAHCELVDTGRGMQPRPDVGDSISHAERALTAIYPVDPVTDETKAILTELVWGERGSLGPALANVCCPEFTFVSERSGEAWTQSFQHGVPNGPASKLGPTDRRGTTIRLRALCDIDVMAVARLVDQLSDRIPTLEISCR
jgi:DNA gyrase/topoisomerase IV subunit B